MTAVKKLSPSQASGFSRVANEADLIREVSTLISGITGVQLGEKQYSLVQGRLAKRLRELKIDSPAAYAKHFVENEGVETGILISLLTTHHTYFFREFSHFEFLLQKTLPNLIKSHKAKGLDTIRIWSAACSRGQEVYSLAMFLKHHLPQLAPGMKFEIVGSDVDEESVGIAKNGVYTWDEVKAIPSTYLQGNWMRGSGDIAQFVRAKDDLRKGLKFQVVNLMNVSQVFPASSQPKFDIIFCRNVFIYFTHQQIKAITQDFLKLLNPDGHLFIGLSESLNGLELPVDWVGPSVYASKSATARPTTDATVSAPSASVGGKPAPRPATTGGNVVPMRVTQPVAQAQPAAKIRVLCVDDSPTVLMLLKKVLTGDKGFEIVGTAGDGEDAAEKAKSLKPDVITLDIHMPKLTGVGYLEKYHASVKVPVVMVSSVSREDSQLAFRALELGAADYIEKPSLQNLSQIEEELLFKLRAAFESSSRGGVQPARLEVDASFKRPTTITKPETKLRVVVAGFGARDQVLTLLKDFRGTQPPTVVLMDGAKDLLRDWVTKNASKVSGIKTDAPTSAKGLAPGGIWFLDLKQAYDMVRRDSKGLQVSILAPGALSGEMAKRLLAFDGAHLVIEDRGEKIRADLVGRADQIVPVTSFSYESEKYLSGGGK